MKKLVLILLVALSQVSVALEKKIIAGSFGLEEEIIYDSVGNKFLVGPRSIFIDMNEQKTVEFPNSHQYNSKRLFTFNLVNCTAVAYITQSRLKTTVTMSHFSPDYDAATGKNVKAEYQGLGLGLHYQKYRLGQAIKTYHTDVDARKALLVVVPTDHKKAQTESLYLRHIKELEEKTGTKAIVLPYRDTLKYEPRSFVVKNSHGNTSYSYFEDNHIPHKLYDENEFNQEMKGSINELFRKKISFLQDLEGDFDDIDKE